MSHCQHITIIIKILTDSDNKILTTKAFTGTSPDDVIERAYQYKQSVITKYKKCHIVEKIKNH